MVTRWPRECSEKVDHPHHAGIWFNYGDVNRYDFWNNSDSIPKDKKGGYGTIVHKKIGKSGKKRLNHFKEQQQDWMNAISSSANRAALIHFRSYDLVRIIDRITTLTMGKGFVFMNDNKKV